MSVEQILKESDSDFVMFVTRWCPYCTRAKNLLDAKELTWADHDVSDQPDLQMEVVDITGHRTVPAIWDTRGDEPVFIGGSDNLSDYL